MGLLCPPYILRLEFKSKEELQLMPQTTEEHMELENDDDDKSDSEKNLDADVSFFFFFVFFGAFYWIIISILTKKNYVLNNIKLL